MAKYNPILGPKGLQCLAQAKYPKQFTDTAGPDRCGTGKAGRCGECRPCWRLFVWQCRELGVKLPKLRHFQGVQRFAGFRFMDTKHRRDASRKE